MVFEIIFSALVLALLIYLSIKDTSWGVMMIVALLPTYLVRLTLGGVPFTLLESLIITLTIVFLVKSIYHRQLFLIGKNILTCKFALPTLLFLLAATIAIFVAPDKLAALGIWKAYFLEPIIFLIIFIRVVKTKKQLNQAIVALIASASFIAITTIIQYATGIGIPASYNLEDARRATAFYGYPAAVGLFIAPILSFLLGLVITAFRSGKNREQILSDKKLFLAGILSILMALAIMFAQTEGAYLGILVAIFCVLLFTKFRFETLIAFLVFLIIILAIPSTREYFITLATFQDVSGEVRLVLWQGTIRLLADNPIFGSGLAGFPALYAQYKEARHVELSLYPHNIILNFWAETGILGVMAFGIIIFQYLKQGIKASRIRSSTKALNVSQAPAVASGYSLPLLAAMMCLLVYGLVDVPYFKNDLALLFWILVGMMIVDQKLIQSNTKTNSSNHANT